MSRRAPRSSRPLAWGSDAESALNRGSRAGVLNERATMPSVGGTTPA